MHYSIYLFQFCQIINFHVVIDGLDPSIPKLDTHHLQYNLITVLVKCLYSTEDLEHCSI